MTKKEKDIINECYSNIVQSCEECSFVVPGEAFVTKTQSPKVVVEVSKVVDLMKDMLDRIESAENYKKSSN